MRTQWTTKGNRDTGSSCSCDRGLHRYLWNFGGGGVEPPKPPLGTPLLADIILSSFKSLSFLRFIKERSMHASTNKKQTNKHTHTHTPNTCFIFFLESSIIRFSVGNALIQMILCACFKLCNEKAHDLCSVPSQQLMPKHDNGPHLIQRYKTDKQFSAKLQIPYLHYIFQ